MRHLAAGIIVLAMGIAAVAFWPHGTFVRGGHDGQVPFDVSEWKTNFKKHSVPLNEIISGGPPKDGIPAIDTPRFETVAEGDRWLKPREPVALFVQKGDARAYPLQILIWHEIVNDVVGGSPATVTFCPLCNTTITFDRRLKGRVLDFGTTGKLRLSDLVMYDRQTESWWQQATGEAIVGDLTGKRLTFLPSQVVSWETFKQAYPQGKVSPPGTSSARPRPDPCAADSSSRSSAGTTSGSPGRSSSRRPGSTRPRPPVPKSLQSAARCSAAGDSL